MEYKVGDKVRIISLDRYNEYAKETEVNWKYFPFSCYMKKYCGQIMTISIVGGYSYGMIEDECKYAWTDDMIEGLVEEENNDCEKCGLVRNSTRCLFMDNCPHNKQKTKFGTVSNPIEPKSNAIGLTEDRVNDTKPEPKFKVGDKVILDPYPCVVTDVNWRDSLHGFVYTVRGTDFGKMVGEEDLIFDTSEETPKFKINDIVFVNNIGWVRITNSYWDSLANEYIYEAIGFNGEGEYDSINQSNIECQMLSESENPHTCGNKITIDEYKNNDKEWLFNKLAMLDNITALESIQDIFNHLQQSKYPKTYEECCKVLGIEGHRLMFNKKDITEYEENIIYKIGKLENLIVCRNAYWKIAGEEMGLGKPWSPDYDSGVNKYGIICMNGVVQKSGPTTNWERHLNKVLDFPTKEMRDVFYEAFKEEIELVKELL